MLSRSRWLRRPRAEGGRGLALLARPPVLEPESVASYALQHFVHLVSQGARAVAFTEEPGTASLLLNQHAEAAAGHGPCRNDFPTCDSDAPALGLPGHPPVVCPSLLPRTVADEVVVDAGEFVGETGGGVEGGEEDARLPARLVCDVYDMVWGELAEACDLVSGCGACVRHKRPHMGRAWRWRWLEQCGALTAPSSTPRRTPIMHRPTTFSQYPADTG